MEFSMDKENSLPPSPPPQNSTPPPLPPLIGPLPNREPNKNDANYTEKVKNFTEVILKSAGLANPSNPLSPEFKTLIGKRIEEKFPQLQRTPDHPPYQIMIRDAIISMNEDKGSTAEAISQFIRKNYADLPYAHDVFFQHYLEQLWKSGVVAEAGGRFFMCSPDINPSSSRAIVSRDESSPSPSLSPSTSISSSSSWDSSASSDTSFSNDPISKRRRRVPLRRIDGTFLPCLMKRQGSVTKGKQVVVREPELSLVPKNKKEKGKKAINVKSNEAVPNASILMLEGPGGSDGPTGRKDGRCRAVLACHDPITGKRRTLLDIDLDELEDLVNEDSMEMDSVGGSSEKGKTVADEDMDEKPLSDFIVYRKRGMKQGSSTKRKNVAEDVAEKPPSDFTVYKKRDPSKIIKNVAEDVAEKPQPDDKNRGSSGMEQDLKAKASETGNGKEAAEDEEENGKLKKRTV